MLTHVGREAIDLRVETALRFQPSPSTGGPTKKHDEQKSVVQCEFADCERSQYCCYALPICSNQTSATRNFRQSTCALADSVACIFVG
jgi:hypothetical protein